MNIYLRRLSMALGIILLAYLYLYPGLNPIFTGEKNIVMSDNTDPAGLPFQYEKMLRVWQEHPSRFFLGSIYSDSEDPTQGTAYWMSWSERGLLLFNSYFLPLEQISTGIVFCLLLVNALAMYLLCRYLKWDRWISYGLAIAWTFCAFMRARAKVHMSMIGTYHVPLIFLGLFLVIRGKTWRSLVGAMACFLVAVTTIHYFIVTSAFLSPFFLAFVGIQPEFRAAWKKVSLRLIGAAIPAILFLVFNLTFTIPSNVRMSAQNAIPETGKTADGGLHKFLFYYAAHPIDYLTGDLSLERKANDLNPLRFLINDYVLSNMTESNPHERTNGIRWSILLISIGLVVALLLKKVPRTNFETRNIFFFAIFAAFAFWLSLPPDWPFANIGPSGWLYRLVPQIRVTNRAGILTHFSLLMIVGYFFASSFQTRWKKYLLIPAVFPTLMILDYPPLIQNMPMATIENVYSSLPPSPQTCGVGIYLPYISSWTDVAFYHFRQRLRGTDCWTLNSMGGAPQQYLTDRFPPTVDFVQAADRVPQIRDSLIQLVNCVPLSWIVFDGSLSPIWAQAVCSELGWKLNPDRTCTAPAFKLWQDRFVERCLR